MIKSILKHTIWILCIACIMLTLKYLTDKSIQPYDIIQFLVIACLIEFGNYCASVFRNDSKK